MATKPTTERRSAAAADLRVSRLAWRVGAVDIFLLLLALAHFFVTPVDISRPFVYFTVLGVFGAVILLFRYTRFLGSRPKVRLFVDCITMIAFITAILALSANDRGAMQNLYLLPVVTSALLLGGRSTLVVIFLIIVCRVMLDQFSGQVALTFGYGLTLLTELAPMLLVAFLTTALAGEFSSAQRRIRALVDQDSLTGLLNMATFMRLLRQEHASARQAGGQYTVLMIDLEALKKLNDQFGHEQGDRAIQAVADALRRSTRADDLIARYGGDEFAVCLAGADEATASAVGNRIRHNVYRTTLDFAQEIRRLTVNIGSGTYPADGKSPRDILAHADRAMYEDKQLRASPPTSDGPDSRMQALGDEF